MGFALIVAVLAALSGNPHVTVDCRSGPFPDGGNYDAVTYIAQSRVEWSEWACPDLRQVDAGRINRMAPEAAALIVLDVAHESGHLAGDSDEGRVECRATHLFGEAAVLLGASHRQARLIVAAALADHELMPAVYRTVC